MIEIKRKIHKIDATDRAPGRLASEIAVILQGKNKPSYLPNIDVGDIVEVSNCDKMKFTGKKLEQKKYVWHTTYRGGLKSKKMKDVFAKNPGEVLKKSVTGMLPKNKLQKNRIKRLIIK